MLKLLIFVSNHINKAFRSIFNESPRRKRAEYQSGINIFGDNYPTKGGTCIRDYIHINNLAKTHFLALKRLISGLPGGKYNLGNGDGYSVREVIESAREITRKTIPINILDRRPGGACRFK